MVRFSNLQFYVLLILVLATFSSGLAPNILGLADEALLVYACAWLAGRAVVKPKVDKFTIALVLYVAYSFANSATSKFAPNLVFAFIQSLIHAKLFIVAYVAVKMYETCSFSKYASRVTFRLCLGLFVAGIGGNIVLGEQWNYLIAPQYPIQYRYGFLRPAGYFGHYAPNSYFFSLVLITVSMLTAKSLVPNKATQIRKFFVLVCIDFLMAFALTVRKGLFMIVPYGLYVLSLLSVPQRLLFGAVAASFLIVFVSLIAGTEMYFDSVSNFSNFFSSDHSYLRGLIVFHGFSLFKEFFPVGVGNGLYGTYFSNANYSVYEYVGINPQIFIRDDGALSAIYDSGIASFAAESGFIGILLLGSMIYYFFKANRLSLDAQNFVIFKVLLGFALLLSITEPVFQNGFFTAFFVVCLLYLYSRNHEYKVRGRWYKDGGRSND